GGGTACGPERRGRHSRLARRSPWRRRATRSVPSRDVPFGYNSRARCRHAVPGMLDPALAISEGLAENGLEEAAAFGSRDLDLRFESVADGHELVDLGDDAILLSDWREANRQIEQDRLIQILHGRADRCCFELC